MRHGSKACRLLGTALAFIALGLAAASAAPNAASPAAAAAANAGSPAVPTLTLTAVPPSLTSGGACTLTASIGLSGKTLLLNEQAAGATAFALVGQAITGADGTAAFSVSPAVTTTYRVDYAGDAESAAATARAIVPVAPSISVQAPTSVYGWDRIKVAVTVSPAHPDSMITLERKAAKGWVGVQATSLLQDSTATITWRATRCGTFTYRVTMAADADHAAGSSAEFRVRVKYPNPYRVPVMPAHFVVVDKSQYKLYYLEHGRIVRVFDCVLGRPSLPTPLGHFRVWAKDPRIGGPYGPRRMRYYRNYGIHGTDEPWLLSRFPRSYSHGCTRLSNPHILWLYPRCPIGTQVWNVP